jgi:hypothetical protein
MTIDKLLENLKKFRGTCAPSSWKRRKFSYENDYISGVQVDSSNKWTGLPHNSDMSKMWSIIVKKKKDFTKLSNYIILRSLIDMDTTMINKGQNKGCFGIRLYGMNEESTAGIISKVLDFIFQASTEVCAGVR